MIFLRKSHSANEISEGDIMAFPYSCRALAATVLLLGVPPVFADEAPAKGDLWEVSSKMSMEGMPMEMPAGPTLKVCAPKVWTKPPAPANAHQTCRRSDYMVHENKITWTESCESPAMTGKGEIIRQGNDAYTGSIAYASEQGNMTIKLSGHKVGICDNPS
jgi:hypothetical protein